MILKGFSGRHSPLSPYGPRRLRRRWRFAFRSGLKMTAWQTSQPHGLEQAIYRFKRDLPGWWFTVGECQVSADASCGPTRESPHIALIPKDRRFDDGFHADLPQPASMVDALRTVMSEALAAIEQAA